MDVSLHPVIGLSNKQLIFIYTKLHPIIGQLSMEFEVESMYHTRYIGNSANQNK